MAPEATTGEDHQSGKRRRRRRLRLRTRARAGTRRTLRRARTRPAFARAEQLSRDHGARLGGDLVAGIVSALVTVAYCVSFSALLFQGDLKSGLALGLWALLMGSAVSGLYVALRSTLTPVGTGPDTPAIAVMSVLAATVSAPILARGGGVELAVLHVLLAITLATFVTGAVLFLIGAFRMGQFVRFVPYPVIGGFLAASGWQLVTGSIEVVTGRELQLFAMASGLQPEDVPKLAVAVAFVAVVFLLKSRSESVFVLPLMFFSATLVLDVLLWGLGLASASSGWYLTGSSRPVPWWPPAVALAADIDWRLYLHALAEIGSVAGVTAIALLLDVSSLEVQRARVADLDSEFRHNGIANLIAAPLGGFSGNLSMQSSKLMAETGGVGRASGVVAAVFIGLVLMTGIDLPRLVPTPILAGLLAYVGVRILQEAMSRSPAQNAWMDFALALAIMIVIINFGYLVGVVLGVVGACLMFAISYSRIGVVRRHLTRAAFASNVERSAADARLLREHGGSIHVLWLTGFIFFGSSNGVFEHVRRCVENRTGPGARYLILDFAGVSGFDSSAVMSLVKLRNYCDEHRVALVYCGLDMSMLLTLEQAELFGHGRVHQVLPSRNEALEWCEDRLLADLSETAEPSGGETFEAWLDRELGRPGSHVGLLAYFVRTELSGGEILYRSGEPADTIDLVAAGAIAVSVADGSDRPLRIRRMSGKTVVGEMGFFRQTRRAASVGAEGMTVVYTLSRTDFERMLADSPELAARFLQFIIRALADRVEFANQEIAALI